MDKIIEQRQGICSLDEVLLYENSVILYKFMEGYEVSYEEAQDIFNETKKWLWFCARTSEMKDAGATEVRPMIDDSLFIIDEMWHTFILFTKVYADFCNTYFGFFAHHSPTTQTEKDQFERKLKADPDGLRKEMYETDERQFGLIYDLLGEETLVKWYDTLAKNYSPDKINEIRKRI